MSNYCLCDVCARYRGRPHAIEVAGEQVEGWLDWCTVDDPRAGKIVVHDGTAHLAQLCSGFEQFLPRKL